MENKRKNWTSRPSTVPEKLLDFFFFGKSCLGWLNYFWVCLCYFRKKKKKLDCGNLEYFLSAWSKNTLDFRGISLYWSNRNCWIHFLFAKRGAVVFSKSVCETLLTLRCQEKLLILCVFWANLMSFYFILFEYIDHIIFPCLFLYLQLFRRRTSMLWTCGREWKRNWKGGILTLQGEWLSPNRYFNLH